MSLSKEISTAVYKRDGWSCRHCKCRNGLHPHHVIFQSRGDASEDTPRNLVTLCWQCHAAVHNGHLAVTVLETLENDLRVTFQRLRGWKPQ